MPRTPDPTRDAPAEESISGIRAMMGEGVVQTKGFWADAWSQVLRRPGALCGIAWICVVAFFALFAPFVASGHPLLLVETDGGLSSPLLDRLTAADVLLAAGGLGAALWFLLPLRIDRSQRLAALMLVAAQAAVSVVAVMVFKGWVASPDSPAFVRDLEASGAGRALVAGGAALAPGLLLLAVPSFDRLASRLALNGAVAAVVGVTLWATWSPGLNTFDYDERVRAGEARAVYTLIPWSPAQRFGDRDTKNLPPGATSGQGLVNNVVSGLPARPTIGPDGVPVPELSPSDVAEARSRIDGLPLTDDERGALAAVFDRAVADAAGDARPLLRRDVSGALGAELAGVGRPYLLGTDASGQDVLSQLVHASRLAISIGFVATGIAVLIGVTLGALMGYFGGALDLLLYRVVEIFMAVPVLFILIVAAGVLPRNTYVMMAIIGCFTWHTAARFIRAEFLKLRNQDFVQAARAVGLPVRAILFRHMLPNGVTPVLVDASFGIAAAILFESVISFLGLGPADQASWGRLLADATGEVGDFIWWLAIFPGLAIFLTVLAYNLVGEALRDAIDPKLKKARV